jgi:beta-galactosidase
VRTLILAVPLLACIPMMALAQAPVSRQVAAPGARQVMALGQGWRFHYGDEGDAPAAPGFDDAGWQAVSVPHSWNRIGEYALTRSAASNNAQGVGWYRLVVNAPAAERDQRQYLDFAAVGAIADVWVNGVHVGQHKGAFGRFRIDVTGQWKPGARNLVAVRADNSKPAIGSSTEDVLPLAGDFFVHGGIYRGVTLITAAEAGIDLLDYGGPGIYAKATRVSADQADIAVRVRLRNQGKAARAFDLVTTIRDAAGNQVAQTRQPVRLKPGAAQADAALAVPRPHLWNGRADPYLYSVTVAVLERGRPVDSVTQPLGIRTFRFDADQGFFLNGRSIKLHGVSRHQDREGKGWALSPADHAEDMALIAELGANTVRMAHYQHADEWVAAADKAGMVAWAEVPYVSTPSLRGGQGSPALWANAEQQLRELIRQDYNHPAIMMWSVGNEVDSAKGFGVKGDPPRPLALLQHLAALAREEDPSRPTTFADCCEELGLIQTAGEQLAGTTDLIGYNRYYGWYYPKPLDARAEFAAKLDHLHAKHPQLPISISEYGAGGAISQHSDNVRAGYLNFTGRPQPEEYESFVHEQTWPVIRDRKYVFASWVWNMFDFTSDLRKEGDSVDLNTKGLVTDDRKTRKDAFYYYQAQWTQAPMIHLTGKRYADRAYPTMEVKAYSNAPRASLSWNGQALGEVACTDGICRWPGVALRAGANQARVTAQKDGQTVTDSAVWTGPDAGQGLFVEAGDLAGHVVAGKRFGSDNFVTGGTPMALNIGGFGGMQPKQRKVEAQTPALYDYWREGEAFSYALPVPNGQWKVTIHTFEPRPAAPDTVMMRVSANGAPALAPFSVKQAAGGALKGIARSFPVTVSDGVLHLDFAGIGGRAVVAAIAVTR